MNTQLKLRLLKRLANKNNKGFTLIELLVVVIIVGVLAAVALPNLLGQVGKARETEAKSALGALNRSQQAYLLEKQVFYSDENWNGALGVAPGTDFYTYSNTTADGATDDADIQATASDAPNDGTRDYAAGVSYDNTDGSFASILCVEEEIDGSGAEAAGNSCTTGDPIQ